MIQRGELVTIALQGLWGIILFRVFTLSARIKNTNQNQETIMHGKRPSIPLSVVLSVLSFVLFDNAAALAAEKLTRIADNVYAFVDTRKSGPANSFGANAGIVIGANGVAVVDTLVSAKEAKRFIKAIRTVTKKPIKYVINTHYHLDHAFGNAEFVKLGAVVVAQENDARAMEKTAAETLKNAGQFGLTAEDLKGTTLAYPTVVYGDRLTLDLGGRKVELRHARPSHTDGDTVVYLPDSKVLFTGDILFTDYHPFLAEGDLEGWGTQLDELAAMDTEKIVPGHGPVSTKKDLADMKQYLILFDREAKALAAKGGAPEALTGEMLKVLPPRAEAAWLVTANLTMRYLKQ